MSTQPAVSATTPSPDTEQLAQAAMQRLSYFINRSAGQHRRAVAQQFATARDNLARQATPGSNHP